MKCVRCRIFFQRAAFSVVFSGTLVTDPDKIVYVYFPPCVSCHMRRAWAPTPSGKALRGEATLHMEPDPLPPSPHPSAVRCVPGCLCVLFKMSLLIHSKV